MKNEEVKSYLEEQRGSEEFLLKKNKRCVDCVLLFVDEKTLEQHCKDYHNKSSPYICDTCSSRFSNKRHLSAHIQQHRYKYACTLCDYSCHDKTLRSTHCKRRHPKIFQCVKCLLNSGNRREFFKHYKAWHERFECHHCGVTFKMKYCIKQHLRKQHSPFEFAPCNKSFAHYNRLWLHNKTTHGEAAPAYCVECDRRYRDVYRYKWHLANSATHTPRTHTRVPCPGCDKVVSKNIYIKDHYNLVHLKYYKYRCEQCDKNFIRNADLVKHRRRVHEGVLPPKYKICYMCGRGFTTNKILLNHVRTHTGEQPHACESCGVRFTALYHTDADFKTYPLIHKHTINLVMVTPTPSALD
ncbi:zinc finger protein 711-like [Anticarsia gemmatalis]|uniref:zinc finger protein 711-like n=1 Tax=Anticarsia gemmatalis TaxID=129554 RepID=UPI003F765179